MSNTIDLSALLAPVEAPTKDAKRTSAPSVPSLALPTSDRPSLLTLTGLTKATSRALFDLMRQEPQQATPNTLISMTDTARAVMSVTCTAKTPKKRASLDADPCDAVFAFSAPRRDTSRADTNAHSAMPSTARLCAVLLSHVASQTSVRNLCIALDAKRDFTSDHVAVVPNTHDPLVVIIAFAVAVRPCCDTLTLDLINNLCDALTLPRPTLA